MPDFKTEFPDYPATSLPAIPAGFDDSSYRNDICPSFTHEVFKLMIWADFPDVADREFPKWRRYRVSAINSNDELTDVFASDDWQAVLRFLSPLINQ